MSALGQRSLWDPPEPAPAAAGRARARGIAAARAHADPAWKQAAADAVVWCAAHLAGFTTDDVLDRLAATGAPATHNLAALGPVMLAAARQGQVVKTGEWRPSRLARRHRDLVVWAAP